MRVTDLTKQNAIVRNLGHSSERLQKLQEEMSSGRRINRLSDDPLGATQAQDLRTKISFLNALQRNIRTNYIWLDRTEAELTHVSGLLLRAKTLLLSEANANADEATRDVTATEYKSIIEALVNSGNSKIGKVFIFAGSKTLTQPLTFGDETRPALISSENVGTDIKFLLNLKQFEADFQGFTTNEYMVRITRTGEAGKARFTVSDDGGETWSRERTLLPVVEVFNEEGKPSDKVLLKFTGPQKDALGAPIVFPEGLEFKMEPNPPVVYHGNNDRRMVSIGEGLTVPLNLTARDVYFEDADRPDSVNIFEVLTATKRALQENDSKALERRLDDLDHAYEQVLRNIASVGAVRKELESRLERLDGRTFTHITQMSEIEDLDFPAAVTEVNLADVQFKAALDTSGRLIQPSLLNFLR